jgi:hypothetical protein
LYTHLRQQLVSAHRGIDTHRQQGRLCSEVVAVAGTTHPTTGGGRDGSISSRDSDTGSETGQHGGDYWARTCAGSRCQRTEVSTHVVGRAQVPEQARSCGQGERMRAADADDYCLSGVAVAGTTQPTTGGGCDGRRSSSRDSDTGSEMVVPTLASRDAHPLLSAYT